MWFYVFKCTHRTSVFASLNDETNNSMASLRLVDSAAQFQFRIRCTLWGAAEGTSTGDRAVQREQKKRVKGSSPLKE